MELCSIKAVSFRAFAALPCAILLMAQPPMDRDQHGPWTRYVTTPKGTRIDAPAPNPLAHFTRYPALLDESGDFCYRCSPQKRMSMAMAAREPRAEVHIVGNIKGLTIYDVFYRFRSEGAIDWKSILVRTGADRYREIYHDEPNEGRPNPSFLIKLGDQMVLGVHDNEYRMDAVEEYWCFTENGAIRMDLTPVWGAARKAISADQFIIERPGGRVNFPHLLISVPTLARDSQPCCEVRGVVTVKLRMQQCAVQAGEVDFQPSSNPGRR